jgi:hypothetical protein
MTNYIEFTTDHRENTFGSPVHDGKRPRPFREIDGVRVDGEIVQFLDESIPDRLGRYFVEAKKLQKRKIVNDCVAFVALMNSVELKDREHNPFTDFDANTLVTESLDTPVVLTTRFREGMIIPTHIVLPAHLQQQKNYLHKLGDDGPLCMSDLETAMRIMGCTGAHLVN